MIVIDDDLGISGAGHHERLASAGFWRRCVMVESAPYWQWKRLDLPAIIAIGIT